MSAVIVERRLEKLRRLRELQAEREAARAARWHRYRDDPLGFVGDVLDVFLWSAQREIVESVWANRYTAVPSAHDLGKTFDAAVVASTWLSVHEPGTAFVVSTAPTFAQVRAILWREIGRLHRRAALPGNVNQTEWWINSEIVAYGRKPANWDPSAFQGIHATYVLAIIDEACGVPRAIYDAVDSIVTNESSRVLAIGNPDDPTSHFERICRPNSGWNVIHLDGLASPNFTGEPIPETLRADLLSPTWVEERRQRWGEESALWESKVRGHFPAMVADQLIPLAWIERARERFTEIVDAAAAGEDWATAEMDAGVALGVDVARGGGDESVVAVRQGRRVWLGFTDAGDDTMRVTGAASKLAGDLGAGRIGVDVIGVGAGVHDRLAELGLPVEALNASWAPQERDQLGRPRFDGIRSEWWWAVRELFDPAEIGRTNEYLAVDPADDLLAEQLGAMKWRLDSQGRIHVESKAEMAERGVGSPDRADALMYTIARAPRDQLVIDDSREDFTISPV